jgi:hypothetical protein
MRRSEALRCSGLLACGAVTARRRAASWLPRQPARSAATGSAHCSGGCAARRRHAPPTNERCDQLCFDRPRLTRLAPHALAWPPAFGRRRLTQCLLFDLLSRPLRGAAAAAVSGVSPCIGLTRARAACALVAGGRGRGRAGWRLQWRPPDSRARAARRRRALVGPAPAVNSLLQRTETRSRASRPRPRPPSPNPAQIVRWRPSGRASPREGRPGAPRTPWTRPSRRGARRVRRRRARPAQAPAATRA